MIKHFVYLSIIAVSFFACTKDLPEPYSLEQSFKYFPLTPGTERVYEVTNINIDLLSKVQDTNVYLIKETVTDKIIDTLNYKLYAITRQIKTETEPYWKDYSQYGIQKHKRSLVRVDNNIPLHILEFPEQKRKEWDGNAFNTMAVEYFEIDETLTQDTVAAGILDSVMIIVHDYTPTLYTYDHREERYAYNIGMCSATYIDAESQFDQGLAINLADPILSRITKGTLVYYNLVSYNIPE